MCEGLEVVVSVDVGAFLHGNLTENLDGYKKIRQNIVVNLILNDAKLKFWLDLA